MSTGPHAGPQRRQTCPESATATTTAGWAAAAPAAATEVYTAHSAAAMLHGPWAMADGAARHIGTVPYHTTGHKPRAKPHATRHHGLHPISSRHRGLCATGRRGGGAASALLGSRAPQMAVAYTQIYSEAPTTPLSAHFPTECATGAASCRRRRQQQRRPAAPPQQRPAGPPLQIYGCDNLRSRHASSRPLGRCHAAVV